MSLRVWLPLTKDTRNQGLMELPTPWTVWSKNEGGKIGQYCYSDCAIYHKEEEWLDNKWSLSCWVKSSNWGTYNDILMCKNTSESSQSQFYFSIIGGTQLNLGTNGGSDGVGYNYTFSTNTWYHVTATYDGTIACLYINGEKVKTQSYPTAKLNGMNNFCIGCRSSNATGTSATGNGSKKFNDVRIYDHALSPLEVKQISQGLILHYPLNRNGWGNENLLVDTYNWSTLTGTSTISEGYWYSNGGTAVRGYDNINNITYCKIWHSDSSSWTRYSRQYITMQPNTYYTVSILCRINTDIAHLSIRNDRNEAITLFATNVELTNKNWEWKFFTAKTHTNTSQEPFVIYAHINSDGVLSSDTSIDIAMIKLEEGSIATPWCPNSSDALAITMGLNDNIEYDTSGYCNNGTRTGTFSWTSDTPKYGVSTKFTTEPNAISFASNFSHLTTFTYSCWIKTNVSQSAFLLMGYRFGNNTSGSLALNGTQGGFHYYAHAGTYADVTIKGSVNCCDNQWHMITATYDDSKVIVYIDGAKAAEGTVTLLTTARTFSLNYPSGASGRYFNGLLSDARVYATALSADDVKSLYNNSAYIDNQGNIYGAVYEEV